VLKLSRNVVCDPPIKPMLRAPVTTRWKLKHDELLSGFALNFNLRPWMAAAGAAAATAATAAMTELIVTLPAPVDPSRPPVGCAWVQEGAYTRPVLSST